MFDPRQAEVSRETGETKVHALVELDAPRPSEIETGIGFFDHMLDLFATHGRFGLTIRCEGDLHVDEHHTVEDVAITLGRAFSEALGDKAHIARFGHAYVPMDEALARAVVDLSGRFALHFDAEFSRPSVGTLSTEMVEHFWYSFAEQVRCNLHLTLLYGRNAHHQAEAIFKASARAFRAAVSRDAGLPEVLSTKGAL